MPTGSNEIIEALVAALIDCRFMLHDYVVGHTNNSTAGQARSCLRDADAAIARAVKAREEDKIS